MSRSFTKLGKRSLNCDAVKALRRLGITWEKSEFSSLEETQRFAKNLKHLATSYEVGCDSIDYNFTDGSMVVLWKANSYGKIEFSYPPIGNVLKLEGLDEEEYFN